MRLGSITVARRFRGPPHSANGGYIAGRLAAFVDGPAEIALRSPPPLETEMTVVAIEADTVNLLDGDQIVATARARVVEAVTFPKTDLALARDAMARTLPADRHPLPMCFVCGPDREDGLRIFPGPIDEDDAWDGPLATPWIPGNDLVDESGLVAREFVWAALDCPTGYTFTETGKAPPILLGRLAVEITSRPRAGEACVVLARETRRDGRKLFAQAALHTSKGAALAIAEATWLLVDREVRLGASS